MENIRSYGKPPFEVAVIHGGPGAAGDMAPVARELSSTRGILEPLQTIDSVAGQIKELKHTLKACGNSPYIIIGYSWGAWLSYIFTAENPEMIKKLILISSGPFHDKYTSSIMDTRLKRLTSKEQELALSLLNSLDSAPGVNKTALIEFGKLMGKTDNFDPIPELVKECSDNVKIDSKLYHSIWKEAGRLRANGELLEFGYNISCPILAIHGDYDPHPAEGVKEPLSRFIPNFRFVLLEKCGHCPWIEKHAREKFFRILHKEIS